MKILHSFLLAGVLLAGGASAQQYKPGITTVSAPQGTLTLSSGLVNNFNGHSFHVYTFQFQPKGSDATWNQLPLLQRPDAAPAEFVLTATATADFPLRDARVVPEADGLALYVAQLKFKVTPYDDDATVELRRYQLIRQQDEERWVFVLRTTRNLGTGKDVSQALAELPSR